MPNLPEGENPTGSEALDSRRLVLLAMLQVVQRVGDEMKKIGLFLLIFVFPVLMGFLLVSEASCSEKPDIREAVKRNVFVKVSDGQGSGVMMTCVGTVATVITNFHLLKAGGPTLVLFPISNGWHGIPAKVVKADPEADLALLSIHYQCNADEPVLTPRFGTIGLLDDVFYVGYPAMELVVSPGVVIGFGKDGGTIHSNVLAIGGFSGSGLWDYKGNLVGINNSMFSSVPNRSWAAAAIPISAVKEFLK